MAKTNVFLETNDKFDITPMIDIVFLLLIYFMCLPLQQEADISIRLPSNTPPSADIRLPNKHIIEVYPNGLVLLNGAPVDDKASRTMPQLVNTLTRLRLSAERIGDDTIVEIQADPDSKHQRSTDILNACAMANITKVSFARSI